MWGFFALALLGSACPAAALAQQRTSAARLALVELAGVLGESHAIRQACEGRGDQFWRGRMQQLLEQEAAEAGLKTPLSVAFNNGYHAGQGRYRKCSAAARARARSIAASGKALSERLEAP